MLTETMITFPSSVYHKEALVYMDDTAAPKACIFYIHGGGLLYGDKKDLPMTHKILLTQAGYLIIALDYPLAPAAKIDFILQDLADSVNKYLQSPEFYISGSLLSPEETRLPYFLWGRSCGAYLALLLAARNMPDQKPAGILSYYGYGFLCDHWYQTPASYYQTLPAVNETCLTGIPQEIHAAGDLDHHYSVYVYARQTGRWTDLFYDGKAKDFLLQYSLRLTDTLPCPVFAAHSTGDTDVPYQEFLEFCSKYQPKRFIATAKVHDFDRDENSSYTKRLLESTVAFLDQKIK